jgi:hypothetical protein
MSAKFPYSKRYRQSILAFSKVERNLNSGREIEMDNRVEVLTKFRVALLLAKLSLADEDWADDRERLSGILDELLAEVDERLVPAQP